MESIKQYHAEIADAFNAYNSPLTSILADVSCILDRIVAR